MLLIKNAKILTMAKANYQNGFIVLNNGKIDELGEMEKLDVTRYEHEAAEVIDAKGQYVLPGFIDAHTHLGIANSNLRWEGEDYNEVSDPVTPHLRTIDGIYGFDESFTDSLSGGVTAVAISPGSANVIGGLICAVKTGGSHNIDKLVINNSLAMKCALGENPKNVYGQWLKKAPYTRMASAAILRESFFKAREYLEKKDKSREGVTDGDKKPDFNFKYEALIPVLKREVAMHIHCHRADDIYTAIRVSKEFNLRTVIIHATESHLLAEDIKASGYPIIVGPTMTFKVKPEVQNKSFTTIKSLLDIGVKASITTDHPVIPLQQLNICAALCVQAGLSEEEALKTITIYGAEIMGLADRIGSLEVGKDADLALWNNHPFNATAKVLTTIIDGKIVYKE
ncbi:MAG: amidohydrolase [Spirochaetaceae bacterium]|nr:amidohydrolase [Spirochaetaceae bacterium]